MLPIRLQSYLLHHGAQRIGVQGGAAHSAQDVLAAVAQHHPAGCREDAGQAA